MAVKETMAFLGDSGRINPELMRKLARKGYRLLFFSEDVRRMEKLSQELDLEDEQADVEMVECAKEGCWEADIIAFVEPAEIGAGLIKKVREVSTQKILLCIETTENPGGGFSGDQLERLQKDFPFSKVVYLKVDTQARNVQVQGEKSEAEETITRIFETSGFEVTPIAINQ